MLSAYFDEELTQADRQRVRLHMEECEDCRTTLREMYEIRQLTAQMKFRQPPEAVMDALEARMSVQASRSAGWTLTIIGLLGFVAYVLVYAMKHFRWPTLLETIAGGAATGVLLLFVSVLWQRWLERAHDRYRKVRR
jgi:anti-sigma factor RsiW